MLAIIEAAGWPIWPLILASVIAVAIIIERAYSLRMQEVAPASLLVETIKANHERGVTQELVTKLADSSPLGRIFATALKNAHNSREIMKESIEESGRAVTQELDRFLTSLAHHRQHGTAPGMVSPAEFIPVAEQTGLIHSIGDWVIRDACRQAKAWQDAGLGALRVAVNLSPVQLRADDIVERVQGLLAEVGLEPRFLEMEITESAFMHDIERSAHTLHQLRNLGVHISLDDFGTGYSSLSYLKRLPVDSLKIDGSFVSDMVADREGTVLVSAIIAMAQHLGIRVIAEGVETAEQLRLLPAMSAGMPFFVASSTQHEWSANAS